MGARPDHPIPVIEIGATPAAARLAPPLQRNEVCARVSFRWESAFAALVELNGAEPANVDNLDQKLARHVYASRSFRVTGSASSSR